MQWLPQTRAQRIRALFLGVIFIFVAGWFVLKPLTLWIFYQPQAGDVVFQSLPGGYDLVEAIEGITRSPFSHCGAVEKIDGKWMVIEAIGEVRRTPLLLWIARGRGSRITVCRLKEPYRHHIPTMTLAMDHLLGQPYDFRYKFGDDEIYCSELVFRGYQIATQGEALGTLRTLGSMNWKPYTQVIQKYEQCGPDNLPLDRSMITPRDLAEAPQLEQVFSCRF
jgi:hypothetical protein